MKELILIPLLCVFFCRLDCQVDGKTSEPQFVIRSVSGKTYCVNITNGSTKKAVDMAFCDQKQTLKQRKLSRKTTKRKRRRSATKKRRAPSQQQRTNPLSIVACLKHCFDEEQEYCQAYMSIVECQKIYGEQESGPQICRDVKRGKKIENLLKHEIDNTWVLVDKSKGIEVQWCAKKSTCRTCSTSDALKLPRTRNQKPKSKSTIQCWHAGRRTCEMAGIKSECDSKRDLYYTEKECLAVVKRTCYEVNNYGTCVNVYEKGKICNLGYLDEKTCTDNRVPNECYMFDKSKKACVTVKIFEKCNFKPGHSWHKSACQRENNFITCYRYDKGSQQCVYGAEKPSEDCIGAGYYLEYDACIAGHMDA